MRFFCTQPDIVEDVQAVRYHTKSSKPTPSAPKSSSSHTGGGGVGSVVLPPSSTRLPPSSRISNTRNKLHSQTHLHSHTQLPPTYNGNGSGSGAVSEGPVRLTRSRTGTAMSALGHGGKKLFGERKGSLNTGRPTTATSAGTAASATSHRSGGSITAAGISAPIPMVTIPVEIGMGMPMGLENGYGLVGKMGVLHSSPPPPLTTLHSSPPPMIVSTRNLDVENASLPPPQIQRRDTGESGDNRSGGAGAGDDRRVYNVEEDRRMVDTVERDISKSLDMSHGHSAVTVGMGLVTITDSEREVGRSVTTKQTRRKSRRMSAPLAALGASIANFANVGSGTDTEATVGGGPGGRRKRVSKVMIGSPEGFKHEGHVGMGGAMTMMTAADTGTARTETGGGTGFLSSPEVPESWNVEAWRAEIERTLSPTTTPPTLPRPKGPRPTSTSNPLASDAETTISNVGGPTRSNNMSTYPINMSTYPNNMATYSNNLPPRNRRRGSVDGAVQKRSIDGYANERRSNEGHSGERRSNDGNTERRSSEGHGERRSNEGYGGASGAMTDAPIGMSVHRQGTSPNRARSGTGGSSGSLHRRSRSGSGSHAQGQSQQSNYGGPTTNGIVGSGSGSIGRAGGMGHGHSSSAGNPNGSSNGHGRSQLHGLGHAHSISQPPHSSPHPNGYGHALGQGSIASLASIPTSNSSIAHTILTPNTTSTSLNRSLSDKPYYPSYHHHHHTISNGSSSNGNGHYQQQQQYHSHLAHLAQSHNPYYHNGGAAQFGMSNAQGGAVILQRSTSAAAALPPSSTSSSATVASVTSLASSVTAYGGAGMHANSHANTNGYGSATGSTRKPIPAQRRKPVPQHLPATAEVSPFPTLLVVNGAKDAEGKRTPLPFDMDVDVKKEREAMADKGVDVDSAASGGGDDGGPPVPKKVPKGMVPLLGVPGEEAHYVTKSTKARFDGAMAEIASALRDPDAESPFIGAVFLNPPDHNGLPS